MERCNIFIIDDEIANLESLERIFKSEGAMVNVFLDPKKAINEIRNYPVDIVITDLKMKSIDGIEVLSTIKTIDESIEVIVITAFGSVELAVEAMKKGAYDFISKPLHRMQVIKTVQRALEKRRLVNENRLLREELLLSFGSERCEIVGKSDAFKEMLQIANQAANSWANVLIEGESGTGKGLLAEYIHRNSKAQKSMFVKINCMAIPENLLEAELFGFEMGAFTGAIRKKKGRIELAHNGTLFLDEIGIAPLAFQTKLLRFLQDGEFERLGGVETHKVNTRVISATNTDLKKAIKEGVIREDLYYRLNVINIYVPPLRARKEDIVLLARKFIDDSAKKNGRTAPLLSSEAIDCLIGYYWPGNIRELQNLMERVVVLDKTGVVKPENLPPEIGGSKKTKSLEVPIGMPLKRVTRLLIDETLKHTDGDKKLTAHLLGIHPRTIYRHMIESDSQVESNL